MWKVKNIGTILFTIVLAVNIAIGSSGAAATELIVHNGESIQAAVDNSKPGDTIVVEPGTYTEKISIHTDNLAIRSMSGNPDNTLMQGPEVFNIYANKITVKGFSIKGTGTSGAIIVSDWMSNCKLENNKFSNYQNGIDLSINGFGNIIQNNSITNCKVGIGLSDCRKTTINSNYISNCGNGIKMFDSPSNTIENNTITENNIAITLGGISDGNTLINNKITLNKQGLDFSAGGHQNYIYNNYFNNTVNVNFGNNIESNSWNTTRVSRKNIVGGPYTGGNYWAIPSGNGFSQTHSDANGDGIFEKPYSLNGANIDYLPLLKPLKSPVAAFSASPISGNVPLKVQFTDKSTGSPISRKWNFGDGTFSTIKNPVHTYSKAGRYTVSLSIKNNNGSNTATKSSYIVATVLRAPVAAFSASPLSGKAPLRVQFTDKSAGSPKSWKWNFGDGTSSTIKNPAHKYNKAGKYTVTLTAKNAAGNNAKIRSGYITVK
ncbi:MAG: PKD domain-containing protein [Alphaproteobacteria bacterium]|nr:MAG: PKD domain-containing protein [Alphaproteobacteria bacterium]